MANPITSPISSRIHSYLFLPTLPRSPVGPPPPPKYDPCLQRTPPPHSLRCPVSAPPPNLGQVGDGRSIGVAVGVWQRHPAGAGVHVARVVGHRSACERIRSSQHCARNRRQWPGTVEKTAEQTAAQTAAQTATETAVEVQAETQKRKRKKAGTMQS